MLEEYLKVKTGKDMIELGIIPKDSSSHMALITYKRLQAIREKILQNTDDEMLGKWVPLFTQKYTDVGTEITDPKQAKKYAKEGMHVIGTRACENKDLNGIEGTIKIVEQDRLGIEWTKNIGGHELDGKCKSGYGWRVPYDAIKLLVPEGKILDDYTLAQGVVADSQLGHKIKFKCQHTGKIKDRHANRVDINVPEGTIGNLIEYSEKDKQIRIRFDTEIDIKGSFDNKKEFTIPLTEIYGSIEVSSLGQIAPLDKEKEIRNQTFNEFFPHTVLEPSRAERILIGLLMKKDMIFDGPPGGGKTNAAKDLEEIAQLQEIIFQVESCKVQCNPYSLFDENFAKIVPPCPECKIKYDPLFKDTGIFRMPKPEDVKVTVAKYGPGHGLESVSGSIRLNRMHLVGYKIPKLDSSADAFLATMTLMLSAMGHKVQAKDIAAPPNKENDYDPEGFKPGSLPGTNNGLLRLEEADKIRSAEMDNLLDAVNDSLVHPDELRYPIPSNQLLIGTANDSSVFSGPINDRILFITIRYTQDPDTNYAITRRSYHNEAVEASYYPISDTHKEKAMELRDVPMPVILETAVDAFYIKFRKEYKSTGMRDIMGSNRCKFDALDSARAHLVLDQIFHKATPAIVLEHHAIEGLQYALCTRVTEKSYDKDSEAKIALRNWVGQEFPNILKAEEDAWWCKAYRDVAIAKTQIPAIEQNFIDELAAYSQDINTAHSAFGKVKNAYSSPQDNDAQLARIEYPLMDYLFRKQPKFAKLNETQLAETIHYFLQSRNNTHCKIGADEKKDQK